MGGGLMSSMWANVSQMTEKPRMRAVLGILAADAADSPGQVESMVVEPASDLAPTCSTTRGTSGWKTLARDCRRRRTWLDPSHGGGCGDCGPMGGPLGDSGHRAH